MGWNPVAGASFCRYLSRNSDCLSAANAESKTVQVSLNVSENVIANHGDNEPWRHSRLRWLNS